MRHHALGSGPGRWLLAAVVGLLATLPSGLVQAEPDSHPTLKDFQRTGQYELRVKDEVLADAQIYHSESAYAYLVVTSAFEFAVLVLPRTRCVESVKTEEMTTREDGGIDVRKDVTPCSLGRFRLEGANVIFPVGDVEARLEPKPPLEGAHRRDAVLEHSPEYERAAKAYVPDAEAMDVLKQSARKARIQIFFGTWCTFCNRFIPCVLRVEEGLAETELAFEYYGLPAPPAAWVSEASTRMGVKRLPTGIIFIDDKEVGRVIGTEWVRPEKALLRYLR